MQKQALFGAALAFVFGAVLYPSLEVLWRGYSHYSMALAGGVACLLLYGLSALYPSLSRVARAAIGGGLILLVEFTFGVVFNIFLGMGVWDYTGKPFAILGQVCPTYALLWCALGYLFAALFDRVRKEMAEGAVA
ncbi:MAG: hypothetical protein IJ012_01935 [Clostridia bacterium]|nr:hypothetical protein [Clostridia bacterium]